MPNVPELVRRIHAEYYPPSIVFSRDGKHLVGRRSDGRLAFWNVGTGILEGILPHERPRASPELATFRITAFALSPDGRSVAAGGAGTRYPSRILLWNVRSARVLRS